MRTAVLGLALAFVVILAFLTLYVLLSSGLDVLVGVSLVVLALVAVGVLGALGTTPPDH